MPNAKYLKTPKFKIEAGSYNQRQILFVQRFQGAGFPEGFDMATIQFFTETTQLNAINLAFFSDELKGTYTPGTTFSYDIADIDSLLPVYAVTTYDDKVAYNYQTVNVPVYSPNNIMTVVGYAGGSLTYNQADFCIVRVGIRAISPYSNG